MANGAAVRPPSSETLDLLVLQAVAMCGPLHGYGIGARVGQFGLESGTALPSLYPAIIRLEQRGLLRACSAPGANHGRSRQYTVTPRGHQYLASATVEWERTSSILTGLFREQDRHQRELAIASNVQSHLFPQQRPVFAGLDYAGACRPALDLGGDYFDFIPISDTELGLAIGDVSGKGVSAALLMATLRAFLRGQATSGSPLTELVSQVNRLLYESSTADRYASLFYGVFDSTRSQLTYVNAGHYPPIFFEGPGRQALGRLETGGSVLGLLPDCTYHQGCVPLEPGCVLLAYTDGITEACNRMDTEWGEDRLIATAMKHGDVPAAELADHVMRAVDRFVLDTPQYDDMTVLVVRGI